MSATVKRLVLLNPENVGCSTLRLMLYNPMYYTDDESRIRAIERHLIRHTGHLYRCPLIKVRSQIQSQR
jgi:hypothetical protein